jgi:hypothetical protein
VGVDNMYEEQTAPKAAGPVRPPNGP